MAHLILTGTGEDIISSRRVSFGDSLGESLNWEEEKSRSHRGFESRRLRKAAKRMAERQHQVRLGVAQEILEDPQYEDRVIQLCENAYIRNQVRFVVGGRGTIAVRLAAFRRHRLHDQNQAPLGSDEVNALASLMNQDAFMAAFAEQLPPTVVTSGSEEEEAEEAITQQERAARARRASLRNYRRVGAQARVNMDRDDARYYPAGIAVRLLKSV